MLQIGTSGQSGAQRLRVLRTSGVSAVDPTPTCQPPGSQSSANWQTYLIGLMPVLAVPPPTIPATPGLIARPFVSMSSSSSNGSISVEMNHDGLIEVPDINIAGLYAHFAARLDEQGWRKDSEGSGTRSATAVWYRTVAPPATAAAGTTDTALTGTLTILHTSGNHYRVQFKLQATLAGQGAGGSNVIVRDFVPVGQVPISPAIGIRGVFAGSAANGAGSFSQGF